MNPQISYVPRVEKGHTSALDVSRMRFFLRAPLPRTYANYIGRKLFRFLLTVQGFVAFALITLGVIVSKFRSARDVILPRTLNEIARSGLRLLPMFLFMSVALGLVVIGQAVSWLSRVGGTHTILGTIMVLAVVRELGPFATALLLLSRSGTANVIELGTARATGEVEALEALGIDPVHYLVVPRVIGMAVGVFCLTTYVILGALVSGYLWAFMQNVPLPPGDYFRQLAESLSSLDFAVVAVKSCLFGFFIAIITCYHGLAQPLALEEVSNATVRAVAQSVIACVLLDILFILLYLAV